MTVQTEITQLNVGLEKSAKLLDDVDAGLGKVERRRVGPRNAQNELAAMVRGMSGFGTALNNLNTQLKAFSTQSLTDQFDRLGQKIATSIKNGFKEANAEILAASNATASQMQKAGNAAGDGFSKGVKSSLRGVSNEISIILNEATRNARAAADVAGLRGLGRKGFVAAELFKAGADDALVAERLGQAYVAIGKALAGLSAEQVRATTTNAASVAQFKNAISAQKSAEKQAADIEKQNAAERIATIKSVGAIAKSVLAARVAEEKTAAAATLANIKSVGNAAKAMLSSRVAEEKSAAASTLANIKSVGNAAKAMLSSRVAEEKSAAAATLASIQEVGAASKRMLAQKKAEGEAQATFERQLRADLNRFINQTADAQIKANNRVAEANEKALKDDLAGYQRMLALKVAAANAAAKQIIKANSAVPNLANYQQAGIPRVQRVQGEGGEFSPYNAREVAKRFKEAGDGARDASKHVRLFTGDSRDALSAVRGLANGLGQALPIFGSLGPILIGTGIGAFVKSTVTLGAAVDTQMKTIQNLSQETTESMSVLNETLIKLGRTGPFGPLEVATAMKTLSLAGLQAAEVNSAVVDVLNFAVAGATNIEKAADVVTSVATAFKFTAASYGYVGDVIAKTAAISKSSVENIGEAFKTASVVNSQFGASLEDVAVSLALLSNVGITGTAAGTAVRNFYTDLSGRSKEVRALLKQIGVDAFDSKGKVKDLTTIFADMTRALGSEATRQKFDALTKILGERGGKVGFEGLQQLGEAAKKLGIEFEKTGVKAANGLDFIVKSIAASAGFVAEAASQMSLTVENQFKSVRASFQTNLVESFNSIQPELVVIAQELKKAFNSPEFKEGLKTLIIGVAKLTLFLVENGKAIATVLAAMAGFGILKSISGMVTTLLPGLKLLAGAKLAVGTAATSAATGAGVFAGAMTALRALNIASIATSVGTLAASLTSFAGIGALIAAAGSKLLAFGGVVVRFLGPIGLLAGALIGLYQAYQLYNKDSKDVGPKFDEAKANSILEFYKEERARNADKITSLKEGITLEEVQSRKRNAQLKEQIDNTASLEQKTLKAAIATRQLELDAAVNSKPSALISFFSKEQAARQKDRDVLQAQKALDLAKQRLKAAEDTAKVTNERINAEKAAYVKEQEEIKRLTLSKEKPPGTKGTVNLNTDSEEKKLRQRSQTLRNFMNEVNKEYEEATKTANEEFRRGTEVLKAELDARQITQGEYYAKSILLTVQNEEALLSAINNFGTRGKAAIEKAYSGLDTGAKNYEQNLEFIIDAQEIFNTKLSEESKRLKINVDTRKTLADLSNTKRIGDDARAFEAAATSLNVYNKELEEQAKAKLKAAGLSEAQRAGLEAEADYINKFAEKLSELNKQYKEAESSVNGLRSTIQKMVDDGAVPPLELTLRLALDEPALAGLKERLSTFEADIKKGAAEQAARATKNKLTEEFNELNKDIKDKLTDAIIDAGKDGGAGLKQTLKGIIGDFLKQKFRIVIDAVLNPISTAIASFINPTAAAAAGQSGGGGLSSLSGITDFYKKVNSNISNGITDGFKKLSESAIGEKLGLSQFGEGPGVFTQTALGKTLGSVLGRLGSTFAGFTAGSALNKGISNGFSINKGVNVAGQLATVVASFFGGPVGGAIAGAIAGGINRLFGRKLKDSGIQGSFGGAAGFQGNSFQFLKGGLFRSDKTVLGDLDPAVVNQLADSFKKVQIQAALAAQTLGLDSNAIANFTKEIKLSFKDLTEEEIEQKLQTELENLGNELASLVLQTREYTIGNETSLETLTRLADTLGPVNAALKVLGAEMFSTSLAGADLASQLADIFGGVEQFTAATAQFYQTFFTEEERLQQTREDIITRFRQIAANGGFNDTMKELEALLNNITRETFRDLVLAQDLTTESGRKTFRELLALSQGFAELVGPTKDATEAIEENTKAQEERKRLEERLLTLQGNTAELRRRELEALDPSNRALLEQIFALEDTKAAAEAAKQAQEEYARSLEEAKSRLESAKSAVDAIMDRIASIQERGTSRYLDAQQRVADAQEAIANLGKEAAESMESFAESIRKFVRDQIIGSADSQVGFSAANKTFQNTLAKAMGGDSKAFGELTDAAGTLLDKARASAATPEAFKAIQRSVFQQLNAAAAANEAAIAAANAATDTVEEDPLIKLNKELADAQAELAEALRVANAINAPLVATQEDLIAEYTAALEELATANVELNAAQAALDKLVANTAGIAPAISELATTIKQAGINAQLEADATIKFIVDQSDLPADLKKLATETLDIIKAVIKFTTDTSDFSDELKLLAVTTASSLTKTVEFIAKSELSDDLKLIALAQTNTLTTTVKAELASGTSEAIKSVLLGSVGEYTTVVKAVASSDISDVLKKVIFEGTGNYVTTIDGVLDSGLSSEIKTLLLNSNTTALKAVTLRAGLESALTADQRKLLDQEAQNVRKVIEAAVSTGTLTADGQRVLAQANETVSKTIQALVNDSSLTASQRNFLGAVTSGSSGSLTLGGTVVFDPNEALKSVFEAVKENTKQALEVAKLQTQEITSRLNDIVTHTKSTATEAYNLAARASGQNNGMVIQFARGAGPGQNVYATGAAFTNGIVQRPTLFNESLMGEAGPEAIMPLTNIGGKLGVAARIPEAVDQSRMAAVIAELAVEISSMKAEIAYLRASNSSENQAMVIATSKVAKLADRWDQEGLLVKTEDTPLKVEVQA